MNRKTKKKLKQEIRSLKNDVWDLSLRLSMNNLFQFRPQPVKVKAIVSMSEYLYPELTIAVITKYTDNMEEILNHVDVKNFLLCYRKADRLKEILEDEHPHSHP